MSESSLTAEMIAGHFDGQLDAAEHDSLCAVLVRDTTAADLFARAARLDAMLWEQYQERNKRRQVDASILDAASSPPAAALEAHTAEGLAEPAQRRLLWWLREKVHNTITVSMILSGLFVTTILLSLALWIIPEGEHSHEAVPSRADYVARIYDMQDAQWNLVDDAAAPQRNDDLLVGQRLDLASGFVRVRYDNGTMVLLEGPAQFVLEGENAGRLERGKLVTRISADAPGYVLQAHRTTIVDLGTEFGALVGEQDDVDVSVFEGKVRVEAPSGKVVLNSGESAVVTPGGRIEHRQGKIQFARRLPREEPGAYPQAVMAAKPLAYYRLSSLEDEQGDRMVAHAVRAGQMRPLPGLNPDGGFPGLEATNRWANFAGGATEVLTDLKSDWTSNAGAISYWVRLDPAASVSGTHVFASRSDQGAFDARANLGCIGTYGRVNGTFGIVIDGAQIDAGVIQEPEQWNHLAFTWRRGDAPKTSHLAVYLNGELVKQRDDLNWSEFTIQTARFGKEITDRGRRFKGSVDEIAIFDRAMDGRVIREQYMAAGLKSSGDPSVEPSGD